MNPDRDHLKLLAMFHVLLGALCAFFVLVPISHLFFGISMLTGIWPPGSPEPGPESWAGWILVTSAGFMIFAAVSMAALAVLAAVSLANEKRHGLCVAVACLECVFFPLGTILGIATLMVLFRPSGKELFGLAPGAAAGAEPPPTP